MDQQNAARLISHATLYALSDEDRTPDLDHRTCTRKGCKRRALDDAEYCARHDADIRRYKRDYDKRRRAEWDTAKRCMRCGAAERKKGRPWCPACAIRLDQMRKGLKSDHTSDLDHQSKKERIAKRLIAWTDSPQNEGRVRLRGGKRGAPSLEDRDRQDLRHIQLVLADYEEALNQAYGAEYERMSRAQQDSTRRAAHAGLALAVRLGMEAIVAYGYETPVLVADEIGDLDEEDET